MKVKAIITALFLSLAMLVSVPAFADGKIDINSATAEQLAEVKGIGPKLSGAIVEYRDQHGEFKSVDELTNVRGIGEKSLGHFRARLVAESPKEAKSQ